MENPGKGICKMSQYGLKRGPFDGPTLPGEVSLKEIGADRVVHNRQRNRISSRIKKKREKKDGEKRENAFNVLKFEKAANAAAKKSNLSLGIWIDQLRGMSSAPIDLTSGRGVQKSQSSTEHRRLIRGGGFNSNSRYFEREGEERFIL